VRWGDHEIEFIKEWYVKLRPGRPDATGSWADIRDKGAKVLVGRTPQDIRDKIRAILKKVIGAFSRRTSGVLYSLDIL
jgi:hypothetical protein